MLWKAVPGKGPKPVERDWASSNDTLQAKTTNDRRGDCIQFQYWCGDFSYTAIAN